MFDEKNDKRKIYRFDFHAIDQVGTFFLTLMQLNLEYGSKRLRTSIKRIKSQRSSGDFSGYSFFCGYAVHSLYSCGPGVTCSLGSYLKEHHLPSRIVSL